MSTLKIGDKVMWRGGWGNDAPQEAVVVGLTACEPGEKYGVEVESMPWLLVPHQAVVDLANGHWAYGSQLSPIQ